MLGSLNHICRVRYASIDEVAQLMSSPSGGVLVSAAWQELAISKPPSLSISEDYGKAGRSYTSSFRTWLSERRLIADPVIVRIDFSDGKPTLIIGSVDHPVRFTEDHSLSQKNLQFTHKFWSYPFRLVNVSGTGIFTPEFTQEFT
ncbi:hypothetical protein GCM10027284_09020 [Cyclobacterium sediminis]